MAAVERCYKSWLTARSIVETAFSERFALHASGELVELKTYTVWGEHLFAVEEAALQHENQKQRSSDAEQNKIELCKYILYQDTAGAWRIQAVPVQPGSFISRAGLPQAWRGLRNEALDEVTGAHSAVPAIFSRKQNVSLSRFLSLSFPVFLCRCLQGL